MSRVAVVQTGDLIDDKGVGREGVPRDGALDCRQAGPSEGQGRGGTATLINSVLSIFNAKHHMIFK